VGAGPVGMMMACELARYGLSVRIVDKNSQITDKSKAIVVWPHTLELLDRGDHRQAPAERPLLRADVALREQRPVMEER
jgi:2-polyprenyl-6-methoxyphenol hydroxylase-like FAD-dependent oxidoreductase